MDQSFADKIEKYLVKKLQKSGLRVLNVKRLAGGISREAWQVDTSINPDDGGPSSFVFRFDPQASLLDSSRQVEYAMFRKFLTVPGVPVPEALCVEDDAGTLGAAFIATALLPGVADPGRILAPDLLGAGPRIARKMFEILGVIASTDYMNGLSAVLDEPAIETVWAIQLEHWEERLRNHKIGSLPITSAAIRRLRREPPPRPKRLAVVHGDYRLGNYLYSRDGIVAILDWEMAHIGDPHEDLAWALGRSWRLRAAPDKVAGFLSPEEAIRIWEDASGLKVDERALRWWSLFTNVKAATLWVSGAHQFIRNPSREVTYAAAAWRNLVKQELWMLEDLGVIRS